MEAFELTRVKVLSSRGRQYEEIFTVRLCHAYFDCTSYCSWDVPVRECPIEGVNKMRFFLKSINMDNVEQVQWVTEFPGDDIRNETIRSCIVTFASGRQQNFFRGQARKLFSWLELEEKTEKES